jgi:hypothetical protein
MPVNRVVASTLTISAMNTRPDAISSEPKTPVIANTTAATGISTGA